MITLKLKVTTVSDAGPDTRSVHFLADYQDPRNKEWAPFTPYAELQISVRSDIAEKNFAPGKNFLVTLEEESGLTFAEETFEQAKSARTDKEQGDIGESLKSIRSKLNKMTGLFYEEYEDGRTSD